MGFFANLSHHTYRTQLKKLAVGQEILNEIECTDILDYTLREYNKIFNENPKDIVYLRDGYEFEKFSQTELQYCNKWANKNNIRVISIMAIKRHLFRMLGVGQ